MVRKKMITMKIDEAQLKRIDAAAAEAGQTRTAYITAAAIRTDDTPAPALTAAPEVGARTLAASHAIADAGRAHTGELQKVGRLLNQIAAAANAATKAGHALPAGLADELARARTELSKITTWDIKLEEISAEVIAQLLAPPAERGA